MPELSRKEKAALIKIVWEALHAPPWEEGQGAKDNLIGFGKAIFIHRRKAEDGTFEGIPLREIEEKQFDRFYPFLEKISNAIAEKLLTGDKTTAEQEKKETKQEEKVKEKSEEKTDESEQPVEVE